MPNGNEWREMLTQRGWINEEGRLVAPAESILRVLLPEGRSFAVRAGKPLPDVRIVGDFVLAQEHNVDSAGHTRTTVVAIPFVESIDCLG